jgi:hypothetical protein
MFRRVHASTFIDLAVLLVLLTGILYASLAQFSGNSPAVDLVNGLLQVPIFLLLTLIVFLFFNIFTADAYMRALVSACLAVMSFAIATDVYRIMSGCSGYPLLLNTALRTVGILLAGIVVSRINSTLNRNENVLIHS